MTTITIRWAGPSDAAITSTYKIERTVNNVDWTSLAATQASTAPYVSVSNTLSGNVDYAATTIDLVSGTSISSAGYGWLDDALVQWTGKSTNQLTGVTWHSGYGTYATGTRLYEAHESYADSATIGLNAVLYRITHTNAAGDISAPTYLWFYSPPTPASSNHCVVITNIATDLGVEARSGLGVTATLATDTEFSTAAGSHLDKAMAATKTATTNAFGLAFHHCWKNSARAPVTGSDAAYTFVLDSASTDKLTVSVSTIPDRDWVLLAQIATSAS
jgi:hypothetical protein